MGKIVAVVGPSGVGKTTLVRALSADGDFAAGYEEHSDRPFQALFKQDPRYALANQVDYLIQRADEERRLRLDPRPGLVDGGLDLDFYGFTRLFHTTGWLNDDEYALCRRIHALTRELLPSPDLVLHLTARADVVSRRLADRNRINIVSGQDAGLFNQYLDEWLASLAPHRKMHLDTSDEYPDHAAVRRTLLSRL